LEYGIVIADMTDFSIVSKSLFAGSDLLTLSIKMGAIDMTLSPSIGIVQYPEDVGSVDKVVRAAEKAVNMAKKDYYKHNFCFYKDVQDVVN